MSCDGAACELEARRQQLLLRTLWRETPDATLAGWLRDGAPRQARGLAAYRANGEALAARALAAAYPTVAELVGEEAFAAVAARHWRERPPTCGDMALYGAGLAEAIAADARLASEPYLADCARLDWAVHRAETAADAHGPPEGLQRLATDDPAELAMVLRPGLVLLASHWPIATIWQAHRSREEDRFAPVREAFAQQRGEQALVWREGWRPRVAALAGAEAGFMRALLDARPLSAALEAAGEGFDFEAWLMQALQSGWLAAVLPCLPGPAGEER